MFVADNGRCQFINAHLYLFQPRCVSEIQVNTSFSSFYSHLPPIRGYMMKYDLLYLFLIQEHATILYNCNNFTAMVYFFGGNYL